MLYLDIFLDISAKYEFYRRFPDYIGEKTILSAFSWLYRRKNNFFGVFPIISAKKQFFRRFPDYIGEKTIFSAFSRLYRRKNNFFGVFPIISAKKQFFRSLLHFIDLYRYISVFPLKNPHDFVRVQQTNIINLISNASKH